MPGSSSSGTVPCRSAPPRRISTSDAATRALARINQGANARAADARIVRAKALPCRLRATNLDTVPVTVQAVGICQLPNPIRLNPGHLFDGRGVPMCASNPEATNRRYNISASPLSGLTSGGLRCRCRKGSTSVPANKRSTLSSQEPGLSLALLKSVRAPTRSGNTVGRAKLLELLCYLAVCKV
jgi:hypothetical protein